MVGVKYLESVWLLLAIFQLYYLVCKESFVMVSEVEETLELIKIITETMLKLDDVS